MAIEALIPQLSLGLPPRSEGEGIAGYAKKAREMRLRIWLLTCAVLYQVVLNNQLGLYRLDGFTHRAPGSFFLQDINNHSIVARFFKELEAAEKLPEGAAVKPIVANKINDWPFQVIPRRLHSSTQNSNRELLINPTGDKARP